MNRLPPAPSSSDPEEDADGSLDEERAAKRRKTSDESSPEVKEDQSRQEKTPTQESAHTTASNEAGEDGYSKQIPKGDKPNSHSVNELSRASTPRLPESPRSSPPVEDQLPLPAVYRSTPNNRLRQNLPQSSSPLSSPVLQSSDFLELYEDSSCESSTSPSDLEDIQASHPLSLASGKGTLPNMKGKDLFDASIWADPVRTQVFYTFITSLRQRVKDVEPTRSHRFISHLKDRGKLVRCYTQNIDQIEEKVGLSTTLEDGPGSRGRFSRRSTANNSQLSKMVEEASGDAKSENEQGSSEPGSGGPQPASQSDSGRSNTPVVDEGDQSASQPQQQKAAKPAKPEPSRSSGVECVFLHGSLDQLRCFLCGRGTFWSDNRERETLSGQQPECPHCVGAAVAREERGKRALGVGKLRPDIVLYGEEHPSAHLISPIVTHDLGLCPDMLLILGTSLRVHGLKVLVREFAKAIHNRGGQVVFVNFTKPPESSWGEVIDYWVQWDCDAWVDDLQGRIPKLWQDPQQVKQPTKRKSIEAKEEKPRPPPKNPAAIRDTKATGAYWTLRIVEQLHRITGRSKPTPAVTASKAPSTDSASETKPKPTKRARKKDPIPKSEDLPPAEADGPPAPAPPTTCQFMQPIVFADGLNPKPKGKRARKSAPAALDRKKKKPSSTLNPNHGRASKAAPGVEAEDALVTKPITQDARISISSILDSVKSNPRTRKPKMIDGEEFVKPMVKSRANRTELQFVHSKFTPLPIHNLAPPTSVQPAQPSQPAALPQPVEPPCSSSGPTSFHFNMRPADHDPRIVTRRMTLETDEAERIREMESKYPWPLDAPRAPRTPAQEPASYEIPPAAAQEMCHQQLWDEQHRHVTPGTDYPSLKPQPRGYETRHLEAANALLAIGIGR